MSQPAHNPSRRGLTGLALGTALVLSLSSCGGGNRLSIEKMLDQPEPKKVASNLESLLKKLENPKNNLLPDPRCAMMTVAVELADRSRDFAPDENTGEPIVAPEQYDRLRSLLLKEIDNPGVYYKDRTLAKKGYDKGTVKKHLSSWAAYELANSEFAGQAGLKQLLGVLGNSSYGGYDLAWQRAAAFNTAKNINLIKANPRLQLETLNRTLSARLIAGLPKENMTQTEAELDHLLSVIDSHILNLPLMNRSLASLKTNPKNALVVAAIRRNYRLLDRLVDGGINDSNLQRHLFENVELLRHYAFEHANEEVHTYARNTLVRFAPFTYLDNVIASDDMDKKKRWVQETIQILPVMDAYMATVSPADLEVFALPTFTQSVAQLENRDKEREAYKRAKEGAKEALKKLDEDIKKDEAGISLLPQEPGPNTDDYKLFLAFEDVSAQIVNPALYFPINKFATKRQNFLDQSFELLLSYPSADRQFMLSELYKQEPEQLLNYFVNKHEAEQKSGQDYALQDMLILGNLGQDKRLSPEKQAQAREQAVWFLTQKYEGGNISDLVEASMQFIHQKHPMTLAKALRTGLVHFNDLSQQAAWDYAHAYTASLKQAIALTDKEKNGARPEAWSDYLSSFQTIQERWDFRPFTQCIPFLLKENPNVLVEIAMNDNPVKRKPLASDEKEVVQEDLFDPKINHDLVIARALIISDTLKRAQSSLSKENWDKSILYMIDKFNSSESEELDYTLARSLIELDRSGNKPSDRVVKAITAKYPGFSMLVKDMDASAVEAK